LCVRSEIPQSCSLVKKICHSLVRYLLISDSDLTRTDSQHACETQITTKNERNLHVSLSETFESETQITTKNERNIRVSLSETFKSETQITTTLQQTLC
jgi:hypothetical protein